MKGGERKRLINSILFAEKNARITKKFRLTHAQAWQEGVDRGLVREKRRERGGGKKHLPIIVNFHLREGHIVVSSLSLLQ